ncbi:MAG: hypothetical protein ACOC5U_04510, partial [Candidatus Aminicenantaceae bacterium]
MKLKIFIAAFLGLFCLFSVVLYGAPQKVRVIQVDAAVYLDPDFESRVIMNVPPGAALDVIEKTGEWFAIFGIEMDTEP